MNYGYSMVTGGIVNLGIWRTLIWSLVITGLFIVAGCSGKSDVRLPEVDDRIFSELRVKIRDVIVESEREEHALAIVDELERELRSLIDRRVERQKQFKKLNANYDTSREEFDVFSRESNEEIYLNLQRILAQRNAFIAATTPSEWEHVFDARTEAIENAFRSIESL